MQPYMRPEIARVGCARQWLRSTMKLAGIVDALFGPGLSATAYEADE